MAEQIILPRQGQSVETCLILNWKKKEGEAVAAGEVLVEVETDKAAFEVESTVAGTLLKILRAEGEDVPVLSALAIVGEPGEDIASLVPGEKTAAGAAEPAAATEKPVVAKPAVAARPAAEAQPASAVQPASAAPPASAVQPASAAPPAASTPAGKIAISPRARRAAEAIGLSPEQVCAALPEQRGSGPRGRILERDVQRVADQPGIASRTAKAAAPAAATPAVQIAPAASAAAASAAASAPTAAAHASADFPGPVQEIPVQGIRKLIAERMHASLQGSAQYTLHSSAGAESLLAYRRKLKNTAEELGLQAITINDLLNFAVTRVLMRFPEVNSHFLGDRRLMFERVHLAVAVDTPRGLMVPVIRNADGLSLKQMTAEAARLRKACLESTVTPDELNGGTFTISNMGNLGIEGFTPVLNPPQVAILGVGSVQLKPVERMGEAKFEHFMSLSLTANHQILDGAPAAVFLRELCRAIEEFELLLAG